MNFVVTPTTNDREGSVAIKKPQKKVGFQIEGLIEAASAAYLDKLADGEEE